MSESEEFLCAFAMSFAAGSPTARPASIPANPSQPLDLASVGGAVPADRDSESECLADLLSAVAKSATTGLTEPQAGPLPPSELAPALATSGLAEPSVGPLPPSPAGAPLTGCIGPCGPPSPPSLVPSLDFSQGIPSDGADDSAAERRWWDQVRETEQQRPDEETTPATVVDFASTFRTALQSQYRLPERNPLRQPWEEGVFGEIFGMSGSELLPSLKRATITVLEDDAEVSGCAAPSSTKRLRVLDKGVSFASVVKVRAPVSWSEQREAQFEIGIDLWLSLMKDWGRCKFIELLDSEPPGDAQRAVVTDVFRGKAPSTLLKRGRAVAHLQAFLEERFATFPCLERDLYSCLKKMESDGLPKSRCTSLLEALTFVRHVVGVEEAECLIKSRRCRGIGVVEEFKEAKQAPPLTVRQLLKLHETLETHEDPWTRHFAGCVLIATYSRCRWSDIQHAVELIIDRSSDGVLVYLELRIGVHKTCRLQSKRHRFLHVVSPGLGLKDFGEQWLCSRRDIGLEHVGSMPFCPAPDINGEPTVRGIDSEEATAWLRLILRGEHAPAGEPSSKSFKATVLSWAAKRGVDGLPIQRLGYHASGGLDIVYSRDAQAPYILIVERLLAEVRDGKFRPDETRGGRLVAEPVPLLEPLVEPLLSKGVPGPDASNDVSCAQRQGIKEELETQLPRAPLEVVHDSASEGEEDLASLGSSTDSAEDDGFQPVALVARGEVVPEGFDLWLHASSKIAHLGTSANFRNLLACGRAVGQKHAKLRARALEGGMKPCQFCFKR